MAETFLETLQTYVAQLGEQVTTTEGEWIIKGFIDVSRQIYRVTLDTKVVSKILEIILLPHLENFAHQHGWTLLLANKQNFYPDITFQKPQSDEKYAVDIKSTYRISSQRVNGMTLGAFTGYFRSRTSKKNIMFPYSEYREHLALGVIYTQSLTTSTDQPTFSLDQLATIPSVIHDLIFFAQPKYRIASSLPGSGNTRNIGSVTQIDQLLNGTGPFADLGEAIYDDYWMYYLTEDMAKKAGTPRPYTDLSSYIHYKQHGMPLPVEQILEAERRETGVAPEAGEDEA